MLQYRQYTLQKKKGKINLYLAAHIESIWLTPHLSRGFFIKTSKSGLFTVKINVMKSIHFIHEKYFQAFSSLFLFLRNYESNSFQFLWLTSFLTHC